MQNPIEGITLREYMEIIRKKKWMILAVFFVMVTATAIISFSLPRVYTITMVAELGTAGATEIGEVLYLDSVDNIRAVIEENIFDQNITNALNLAPGAKLGFKISLPRHSKLIKVAMEREEGEVGLGVKTLNQLFQELFNYSQRMNPTHFLCRQAGRFFTKGQKSLQLNSTFAPMI